ncbi:hypothetical protein EBS02_12885, partial [bacterium]|nr:hypothetical protein [bacterium]
PYLPHLFTGEEILMSARLYTMGWDVFTPNQIIVYHLYTRSKAPKYWNDLKSFYEKISLLSTTKVRLLLQLHKNEKEKQEMESQLPSDLKRSLSRYGLGTMRSLTDFYRWIGFDSKKQTFRHQWHHKQK